MKIYQLRADIELLHLRPAKQEDSLDLVRVAGRLMTWDPDRKVAVKTVEWGGPGSSVLVDFAYFESFSPLCLSPFGQRALAPVLEGRGYYADTDFEVDDGVYRLFFPTRRVDAIDLDKSVVRRFDSGAVWEVMKHELHQATLEGETIMTLEHRRSFIFVSDEFVNVIKQENLTGCKLTEIWSSEEGGVDFRLVEHPPGKSPKEERLAQRRKQSEMRKLLETRAKCSSK